VERAGLLDYATNEFKAGEYWSNFSQENSLMVNIVTFVNDFFFPRKRFDRGNCNCQGLIVWKWKREGRQNRRKPAVPRTDLVWLG
jgi:hypothetical protein